MAGRLEQDSAKKNLGEAKTSIRVQFWSLFDPLIVANLLRGLFQVEADLTSNSYGWNLELGKPIFARLHFLTF